MREVFRVYLAGEGKDQRAEREETGAPQPSEPPVKFHNSLVQRSTPLLKLTRLEPKPYPITKPIQSSTTHNSKLSFTDNFYFPTQTPISKSNIIPNLVFHSYAIQTTNVYTFYLFGNSIKIQDVKL
jgi:hypothetical protein